jgi:hypothetical protein
MRSLRQTTSPGVTAMLPPTSKFFAAGGKVAACGALPVIDEIASALDEVHAALPDRALQNLGIGPHEVRRCSRVKHLPGGKFHHGLVMRRDATQADGGFMPPLLMKKEGLEGHIEGELLPSRRHETVVVRLRLDASCRWIAAGAATAGIVGEPIDASIAILASCRPLPGDAARCMAQSMKASASAAGDSPPVLRAMPACSERSRASGAGATVLPESTARAELCSEAGMRSLTVWGRGCMAPVPRASSGLRRRTECLAAVGDDSGGPWEAAARPPEASRCPGGTYKRCRKSGLDLAQRLARAAWA